MIAAIHQPQYMPWIGYMNKIAHADVFVILDTVQYKKNEWQNRNRIKTAAGSQWITVPVCYHYPEKILEVKINNTVRWGAKHYASLVTNYHRAPYFNVYADFFKETLSTQWEFLADLNVFIIESLTHIWGLNTNIIRAHTISVSAQNPTARLVDICLALGADTYLSGRDGMKYMDMKQFADNGIKVIFQQFSSVVYPQLFHEFIPNLSSIDLLLNCGIGASALIFEAGQGISMTNNNSYAHAPLHASSEHLLKSDLREHSTIYTYQENKSGLHN
ncbi:MAG: WbqC family protein [bacterium]